AMLMIHNPATLAYGDQAEMEKTIGMLSEVKESIINAYEIKSGLARTKISHMMDDETWLNAKKAVELGFADEILFDQKKGNEEQPEAMLYSPVTVTNSFVQKLKPKKPLQKVPAAFLENRLALLIH
ncbi:MAG: ATP-dependent Clp protease proteolytic subunit, partial [Megasphaera sp.]